MSNGSRQQDALSLHHDWVGHILGFALHRPVATTMLLLTFLVTGGLAAIRMPLEAMPSGFTWRGLSVNVEFPNAGPLDVEERVLRPIEDALAGMAGLVNVSTHAWGDGGRVYAQFEGETDMDLAFVDARNRLDRLRPTLPERIRQVQLQQWNTDEIPVAYYAVTWPEDLPNAAQVLERQVLRPLRRVDGVASVDMWIDREEVTIDIDREKVQSFGLQLADVAAQLRASNFSLAAGTVRDGARTTYVASRLSWRSFAEIERLPIVPSQTVGRAPVPLGQLAKVRLLPTNEEESFRRYNGLRVSVVSVSKKNQANTVEVGKRLAVAVANIDGSAGLSVRTVFSQAEFIESSLGQVLSAGAQGSLVALVVLLVFLRRLRPTLLVVTSIPLSMFAAIPFMHAVGHSLNLVSLIGLMMCVGMVVDNAVVVAENIDRRRSLGESALDAAVLGSREIALAITLATLTTMIVFLPAALLSGGEVQFFMIRMVIPVCVSLLASLIIALVLVPGLIARERGKVRAFGLHRWLHAMYDHTFGRLAGVYAAALAWTQRHRADTSMVALLMLASVAIPAAHVSMGKSGGFGRETRFRWQIDSTITVGEIDNTLQSIEARVREQFGDILEGIAVEGQRGRAGIQLFFDRDKVPVSDRTEKTKEVRKTLPEPPGWKLSREFRGGGDDSQAGYTITLYGEDRRELADLALDIRTHFETFPGVIAVKLDDAELQPNQLVAEPNLEQAARQGLRIDDLARLMAYAVGRERLSTMAVGRDVLGVWLRTPLESRKTLDQVLQTRTPARETATTMGAPSPSASPTAATQPSRMAEGSTLASLFDMTSESAQTNLSRSYRRSSAQVTLELDPEEAVKTRQALTQALPNLHLPPSVSLSPDPSVASDAEMREDLVGAVLLGTVFVFMVMGFLFESWLLPLAVVPSIPLAFAGAYWALFAFDGDVDPLVGIGMILLVGVVVNNGIVLVDCVNRLRIDGIPRAQALTQAAQSRFRPIMMTTLTTVGGLLPLALAEPPEQGIGYAAFGQSLVGGLLASTLLTLFIVPVAYTYLDDFGRFVRQLRRPSPMQPT